MLDLLETLLPRYGIQNLRYDGKMRSEAREAALAAFRRTGGPKVILISIKCGGVGLNLTIANRVIKCARAFVLTQRGSHRVTQYGSLVELRGGIAGVRSRPSPWAREGRVCEASGCREYYRGAYVATAGRQDGYAMVRFVSLQTRMLMCFPGLADAALGEGTGVKLHKLSVREIKAVRSFILLSHIISPIHALS
jgi:hypothetical protein